MNLKTAYICVLCAATLTQMPSAAAATKNLLCESYQDDGFIKRIRQALDSVSESIPNVPPEHAAFLEAESDAATKALHKEAEQNNWKAPRDSRAGARLYELRHRPYYNAWQVRRSLTEAQDAILAIPKVKDPQYATLMNNPEAEKARRATAAMGKVNALTIAITEMLANERLQPPFTSTNDVGTLSAQRIHIPGEVELYIGCKLRILSQ